MDWTSISWCYPTLGTRKWCMPNGFMQWVFSLQEKLDASICLTEQCSINLRLCIHKKKKVMYVYVKLVLLIELAGHPIPDANLFSYYFFLVWWIMLICLVVNIISWQGSSALQSQDCLDWNVLCKSLTCNTPRTFYTE